LKLVEGETEQKKALLLDLIENLKEAVSLFEYSFKSPPYFCVSYSEDFDEYVVFCFTEPADQQSQVCFTIDIAIVNQENKSVYRFPKASFEVSRVRFNKDFGLDFRLLMKDEKRFFMQSYSKIVQVVRKEEAAGSKESHTAQMREFSVEATRYDSQGATYRLPVMYSLLSNKKQPIAVVVSTFNEFLVRMVGCVLAVNPRSLA